MEVIELVNEVRNFYDADLAIYVGPIKRPFDDRLMDQIKLNKNHPNIVFCLSTFGGDPTAGYRMARALRKNYDKIIVYVNSSCYSAGTMISLAADQMIIDDHAEFGPIDVQIRHKDEIGERISGLTSRSALSLATDETPQTFIRIFQRLRREIGLSTKLAADVASNLTDSTIGKLFQQIDPMRLAEDSRSVKIIEHYAERLASKNVREGALHALVNNYPDHSFVIDPQEVEKEIFHKIDLPCGPLAELGEKIKSGFGKSLYADEPISIFWIDDPESEETPAPEPDSNPIPDPQPNESNTDATDVPEGIDEGNPAAAKASRNADNSKRARGASSQSAGLQ